jgi:beta-galactosidase/beta-glucuronidase
VSIERLELTPDVETGQVRVAVKLRGTPSELKFSAEVRAADTVVARQEGALGSEPLHIDIPHPRLWSPDDPFLYSLKFKVTSAGGEPADEVNSYFAMRTIAIREDESRIPRLVLNGHTLFQFGPLDQGWWPDGLYTAPTDAALRYDLEITKKLGFNMVRKHVKVEPARWYYHCDRLGLLVWQDMPNGDAHIRSDQPDLERSPESAAIYRGEWQAIMEALRGFPCIVVWVPFNEGWGQFETAAILQWTKDHDPTRLVDGPSGWTDRGVGDMHDIHRYPGPAMPEVESRRAIVLGEFGGLGLPLEDHLWWNKRNWGYRTYNSREQLHLAYEALIRRLRPLIGQGLSAAVYTQTTDVEGEVNGLMTYDRAEVKFDVEAIQRLHRWLFAPQETIQLTPLVPTSETAPQTWRYVTTAPADNWSQPEYDDTEWQEGEGGFGEASTPGSVVRTKWTSDDIWLRRTIVVDSKQAKRLFLRAHHDEDAEVYLNGQLIASLSGYVTEYGDMELGERAIAALRDGENVLAVHCHQTGGGQYIDIGLSVAGPAQ